MFDAMWVEVLVSQRDHARENRKFKRGKGVKISGDSFAFTYKEEGTYESYHFRGTWDRRTARAEVEAWTTR